MEFGVHIDSIKNDGDRVIVQYKDKDGKNSEMWVDRLIISIGNSMSTPCCLKAFRASLLTAESAKGRNVGMASRIHSSRAFPLTKNVFSPTKAH